METEKQKPGEKRERIYFLHPGYIIALSILPLAIGFATGVKWLLPLMITIPSFLVMRRWLMKGRVGTAYAEMLLSCVWMSFSFICLSLLFPEHASKVIIKSSSYVEDMSEWINTGGATEGTQSLFIPQHLGHMGIILIVSLLTGGFVALYFGAVQMGYMNYYVAWLISGAEYDTSAIALAWPVWSVVRVLSFVLLAVALAQPLLHLFKWQKFDVRLMFRLAGIAIGLEVVDLILKTILGPVNQSVLNKIMMETPLVTAGMISLPGNSC